MCRFTVRGSAASKLQEEPEEVQVVLSRQGQLFRTWGRVWGLGFGVWGLGFGVWGLGFGVWGLGFGG